MRKSTSRTRAFTIIELMITIAIVGVCAALAVYGVSRYLRSAKTAEAKHCVGAITRGAVAAFEREIAPAEMAQDGGSTQGQMKRLCTSAVPVPQDVTVIQARKYQPRTGDQEDFQTGTDEAGWRCVRFSMTHPIYYQYNYTYKGNDWTGSFKGEFFTATAIGDLDGDNTQARFLRGGMVRNDTEIVLNTKIYKENEND